MIQYPSIIEMCIQEVIEKEDNAFKTICNCRVPTHCLLVEYKRLGYRLEELDGEEKNQIWNFVYGLFPTKSKEERIDCCKIIHLISKLLN